MIFSDILKRIIQISAKGPVRALCCLAAFIALQAAAEAPHKVLILTSTHTSKAECDSLARMVADGNTSVGFADIRSLAPGALKNIRTAIYHRTDSAAIEDYEIAADSVLKPYVEAGGNLMLTMEATRLLNHWNVEPTPLEVEYQDASDSGYGRALGFHGYREHPVFENLSGGAYVWKGLQDHQARTLGFSGSHLPKAAGAKVIGINWAYIHYHDKRKLLWETPLGRGKILAAGAYLYFSEPNVNKSTLRRFTRNTMDYLNGTREFASRPKYWVYDTIPTRKADFPAEAGVEIAEEKPWSPTPLPLHAHRPVEPTNYWNVNGEQILAMGRERGPVEEVWIHPVMVLRDLRVSLLTADSSTPIRLDSVSATLTRSADYLQRTYSVAGGEFTEIITASPSAPLLALNFKWDIPGLKEVRVEYTSNLRLMWPYSHESTGTLHYSVSTDGRTTVFDRDKELNMLGVFDATPTSATQEATSSDKKITFSYAFDASRGNLTMYLSGGEEGIPASAAAIAGAMGNSKGIYESARRHYLDLGRDLTTIETSDPAFNDAYRSAIISTGKFFCHTPSIGKSLMAGYWTTSRGWNGGHKVSGRPGYAWYFGRDTEWTGTVMNSYGDHDKVRDILTTFGNRQDPDGKIYHELTTSGSLHYDASDATPLYIILAGDYMRKSGDVDFIRSQWPRIEKAMNFCLSTDTDGDGLIENTGVGHGWQESHQLHGAHTEVYLAALWTEALKEYAAMARTLGHADQAADASRRMMRSREIINNKFWNDSLAFFNHGLMRDGTFQEQKCVLGGTPVIFGQTDRDKAVATASNFSSRYYSTDWGVRMVGFDSPYFALGGYNYGNIWPFHTGCAATAEYKAGLRTQGFRHAYSTLRLFDTWDYGNIAEVIHGDKLSFTGICPHQQWSSSMNLKPLLDGMLGLRQDAIADSLGIAPAFPVDWSWANVNHIPVGAKRVALDYRRTPESYTYVLKPEKGAGPAIDFRAVLPLATDVRSVRVNGKKTDFKVEHELQNTIVVLPEFALAEPTEIVIDYSGGIGIMLNLAEVKKGMADEGLKIEGERFDARTGTYTANLAGVPGRTYDVKVWEAGREKTYTVTFPTHATERFTPATLTIPATPDK